VAQRARKHKLKMQLNKQFLTHTWMPPSALARRTGFVREAVGTVVRAVGVGAAIGDICLLRNRLGETVEAEVIGFAESRTLLMPFGGLDGLSVDDDVVASGRPLMYPVGESLRGRILDSRGRPLDGLPPMAGESEATVHSLSLNPMGRKRIDEVFITGVKAIDSVLTTGVGQRVGVFAPAGVGKSVLLGMLARNCDSDINVVALIGERGREVREFVEDSLSKKGLERSIVIVATADAGPIERSTAAFAEYFRDQGKRVLLLIDSITRFARAQREIGLARGEPPTRRGFPPSLFTALPQLFERAGCFGKGSITAFYTVLMEDESTPDPVAEEVRSLLDGHIVLSRTMANEGLFPAIDLTASLSRLMSQLGSADHLSAASRARKILSKRAEVDLLLKIGEYKRGVDLDTDDAIDRTAKVEALIRQAQSERFEFVATRQLLADATGIAVA
jgi:ATP synthase in type III secretion protein N